MEERVVESVFSEEEKTGRNAAENSPTVFRMKIQNIMRQLLMVFSPSLDW